MRKKVLVILAEDFEEMEAIIIIDILRRAGIEVVAASCGQQTVKGSRGIFVRADALLEDIEHPFDAVVLPGGMPGAKNLAENNEVINILKNYHDRGKVVAAICASPAYALLKSGVLKGKKATCYPGFENYFGDDIEYLEDDVVVEGNVITSRGPGTAFCFSLAVVEKLIGSEMAEDVKKNALIKY